MQCHYQETYGIEVVMGKTSEFVERKKRGSWVSRFVCLCVGAGEGEREKERERIWINLKKLSPPAPHLPIRIGFLGWGCITVASPLCLSPEVPAVLFLPLSGNHCPPMAAICRVFIFAKGFPEYSPTTFFFLINYIWISRLCFSFLVVGICYFECSWHSFPLKKKVLETISFPLLFLTLENT